MTWRSNTARVSNGRHGLSTMTDPPAGPQNAAAVVATSPYMPTATVSTPSQAAREASRSIPKP